MANFLLEVGTEELPASFVDEAIAQWQSLIPAQLAELELDYSELGVYGTPRRLAVLVRNLPDTQRDRLVEYKGPSLSSAYEGGQPTKALLGFMRAKGLTAADLVQRETDKGVFIFGQQKLAGKPTPEILQGVVLNWITGLQGKRLMRWGMGDFKFPRPIRWLVALWQDQVLPLVLPLSSEHSLQLVSDCTSQGHRVLHPQPVTIPSAGDYASILAGAGVIASPKEREQIIRTQIEGLATQIKGRVKIIPKLLSEVVHLVEYPTAILGEFDPEFLTLPPEVIETEMVSHQRYFPVYDLQGEQLLPYFVTIGNGDPRKSAIIAQGNARVIRARLADGKFFFESDRSMPLAAFLPQLEKVTFQEQLGSVADKVKRMGQILPRLLSAIPNLSLSERELGQTERAIALCKADLVSQMVKEFPELQGIMGGYYALHSGEDPAVAQGIREHYQPQPPSLVGQLTAMCDRLDTLVGIFSVGLLPTGSSDPFALRRAATSIVQMAWAHHYQLNLPQLLSGAIELLHPQPREELYAQLLRWFQQRCETLLAERGIDYDLINALFGEDTAYAEQALADLEDLQQRAEFLQTSRRNGTLGQVYTVVNRASRLAMQNPVQGEVQLAYLTDPAEQALYQQVQALPPHTRDYAQLMADLFAIAPSLSEFFEAVLVMAEDVHVRRNRLALLHRIRDYSRNLADFSYIRSDL
ncbi:MAG: glycine--tRNA ligase subunit beta [Pseudanabaenaceae cyanobacterium]